MCSATFQAIKNMAPELGCVTHDGLQLDRLKRPTWRWLSWIQRSVP